MVKEIRCLVSASVTGQAMSGTYIQSVWEKGGRIGCVIRLDRPVRCGDGVLDYLFVYDRDVQFVGHH